MRWLRNLSIKKRLPLAFSVIAILLIVTGLAGIFGISTLSPIVSEMYRDRLLPVNDLNHVSRAWHIIKTGIVQAAAISGSEERELQRIEETYGVIDSLLGRYQEHELSQKDKTLLAEYQQSAAQYREYSNRLAELIRTGAKEEALALVNGEAAGVFAQLMENLEHIINSELESAALHNQRAQQEAWVVDVVMFVVLALALLLMVVFARTITTSIVKPLERLEKAAHSVAGGDLETVVHSDTQDEIGSLAMSFNTMIASVRSAMHEVELKSREARRSAHKAERALANITLLASEVRIATDNVAQYTSEISASIQQMAAAVEEQAQQTAEVAAASEEMAQTISATAHSVSLTAQSSAQASAASRSGIEAVERTRVSMKAIADVTQETGGKINELTSKVDEVGSISETITEIADQTNLLALNAAIEAARAGTHGRGFAVVADEVRKLAERTAKATKDIGSVLKSIQQETLQAHKSMERAGSVVTSEINSSNELAEAFNRIHHETEQVTELIHQIAVASEEQSLTMGQVSSTIEGMHVVAEESAAGVNQIAQATNQLNDLTINLHALVEKFSSSNDEEDEIDEEYMETVEYRNNSNSRQARQSGSLMQRLQAV